MKRLLAIVASAVLGALAVQAQTSNYEVISSARTYYVAPTGETTCTYNADAGTACTPSDSGPCLTKAAPCATLAGVNTIIRGKVLEAIVTIQLASPASATRCYQPSGVIFDNPSTGGAFPLFPKEIEAQTDVYPQTYLYLQGDTATPNNVIITGATTCAGTTASTKTGFFVKRSNFRVRGVNLNYFDNAALSCVSLAICYGETVNVTSSNPNNNLGFAMECYYQSLCLMGGTWTITNDGALNLAGASLGVDTTPLGQMTLTYSKSSGSEVAFLAQELSHLFVEDGTYTFNGAGTYIMFQAQARGDIQFNGDGTVAITTNAASALMLEAISGGLIQESCGSTNVTCTFTALGQRAKAYGGRINIGPTTTDGAANASAAADNGCILYSTTFPDTLPILCPQTVGGSSPGLVIYGPSTGQSQYQLISAGDSGFMGPIAVLRRSDGTIAGPTAVASGDLLGSIDAQPHDGTSFAQTASIGFEASQAYTSSNHGTRFYISTTADNSTTVTQRAYVDQSGIMRSVANNSFQVNGGMAANVTAAGTLTLGVGNVFHVTGNTNITTLNTCDATNKGRVVVLIFDGTPTLTDGNNLKMAGNLAATADDSWTGACDGTNWYETGRSVN